MEPTSSGSIHEDVFGGLRRRVPRRQGFALRMAPMIDMIFLLLIFFIVTAKWRPQEDFLPLHLASAQARDAVLARPEPLEIHIFAAPAGCRVQIGLVDEVKIDDDTIEADLSTLIAKIQACIAAQKRFAGDPIEIICGGDVKWDHLTKIYNVLFGAGLTDITFRMTE
ncbi:MAG: biopolymer transporter ExbD [Sedimentisphaerales bacterium]|nr:biopolymer transporter ExbD [Sedimentisphaerales bacterium]